MFLLAVTSRPPQSGQGAGTGRFQVVNWQDTRPADQNPRQGKRLEPGHLSLQGHDPTTDLDFRSIRIHPLRSAP